MSAVCAAVNSDLVLRLKLVHFTSNIIIYPITLVCSLFYNLLGIHHTNELLKQSWHNAPIATCVLLLYYENPQCWSEPDV